MKKIITKSIRVTTEEDELLKSVASSLYLSEAALIKSWFKEKLEEFKIKKAVEAYKKFETVSLGKAAEIAGISTREMMEILEKEGISWMPKV